MTILDYVFYFFFYSFVGWCGESIYCSMGNKKWINRGFLRGPLCPIYGTGAMVLLIAILPLREATPYPLLNEFFIFVVGLVLCDVVEFVTSYLMEKLFHARWWDYSGMRFNIQGRICLTHTLYWGTASCIFCYVLHPIIDLFFINQISETSRHLIVYIVLTVFALDLLDTVKNAMGIRSFSTRFHTLSDDIAAFAVTAYSTVESKVGQLSQDGKNDMEETLNELRTRYETLKADAKDKTTRTKKRIMKAFPYLESGRRGQEKLIDELLEDLRQRIGSHTHKK